ncbi:MAG TPA: Eco29kI family restriction endonuclease [Candidatus Saccharimonadales bacterium]|nr:Eco29kI family restriction endonuclease [Candidatus Saccharimonadales bacterium]
METQEPFNPLNKKNLGFSVAEAMLDKAVEPLPPAAAFEGAGIYAIYYTGSFPAYKPIADKNKSNKFDCPIYVGKAVPAGARKGGFGLDAPAGKVLYQRLNEHAESIDQAQNLKLDDFHCRYLAVDDIWIPLGESLLIEMFSPLWNKVVDGFGNHDPGSGRYNQQISPWDILHPGRAWAAKLKPGRSKEEIIQVVSVHLKTK